MKYLFSFCSWSNLWVKTNLHTKGFEFLTKIKTYRIITVLTFPKYAYVRNWPYGWIGPCKNFFFLENSCTHMGLSYMPVWRCLVTGQKLKTPLWKSLGVKISLQKYPCFQNYSISTPPNFIVCARWKVPAKCFKSCHILCILKPKVAFPVFHFMLL